MKRIITGFMIGLVIITAIGCTSESEQDVEKEVLEPGAVEVENRVYQFPDSQIQGLYTGPMIDNVPTGTGTFEYEDTYETVYVGTWVEGLPNGLGTYQWKDGDRYDGEVVEGRLHGYGKYTYKSGVEHEGRFDNGVLMPDKSYPVGEQAPVGEYLVTVLNVIEATAGQGRMMQIQILVDNKFVSELNTAHFLSLQLYDGDSTISYSNISTTADLYAPFKLDEQIEFTAIFEGLSEDSNYQLVYDFDTLGTGAAIFELE